MSRGPKFAVHQSCSVRYDALRACTTCTVHYMIDAQRTLDLPFHLPFSKVGWLWHWTYRAACVCVVLANIGVDDGHTCDL